ncbi:MAG: zf-HC2 domain-containing protein [Spirochaetales bacterium]|nr:zf-HC2 domain-containing protein [Spirochaetales bacterium]
MCPKDEILSAFCDGEIGSPWDKRLQHHINQCARCSGKVAQYREITGLFHNDGVSIGESMKRVKARITNTLAVQQNETVIHPAAGSMHIPFWRKQVMVPMPVLAAGFSVLFVLVASLFFFLGRNDTQVARTTPEPDPQQNIHVYYSMDNPELLRKILSDKEYHEEVIIELPRENDFSIVGEPEVKRIIGSKGN